MLHKNLEEQRPHLHHDRSVESYLKTFFRTRHSVYVFLIYIFIFQVIFP